MARQQPATCRADARTPTAGARVQCVAAPTAGDVDCAVAELTDALVRHGHRDGAIIVTATASCGEDACWIEDRVMRVAAEAVPPPSRERDEVEPLVVNG